MIKRIYQKESINVSEKDLSYYANAEGYQILYKDKRIGGASIKGKFKGRGKAVANQRKEYANNAKQEIENILNGRGQERFYQMIRLIDSGKYEAKKKPYLVFDPREMDDWGVEDFEEALKELLIKKGNNTLVWNIAGRNMGWKGLSGETVAKITNMNDMIDKVLPKTNEFRLEFYIEPYGFLMKCYHHDSPMGETYEFTPSIKKEDTPYD